MFRILALVTVFVATNSAWAFDSNKPKDTKVTFDIVVNGSPLSQWFFGTFVLASSTSDLVAYVRCKEGGPISGGRWTDMEFTTRSNAKKSFYAYNEVEPEKCREKFTEAAQSGRPVTITFGAKELVFVKARNYFRADIEF